MYQLTPSPTSVIDTETWTVISIGNGTPEDIAYAQWLAAGNTPAPYVPPGPLSPESVD